MNAASAVGTMIEGGDTQTLLAVKNSKLFALSGGEDTKRSGTSPRTWD